MIITDLLKENAKKYPNDVALVEINPELQETKRITWKDYNLVESSNKEACRREITWQMFN